MSSANSGNRWPSRSQARKFFRPAEQALPLEKWVEDPAHLRCAFEEAGFQNITLHHNRYSTRISLADFLAIRADAPLGRFMRQKLDRNLYMQFKDALSAEFYSRYHDPIAHVRDVHIAVGTKS